MIRRLALTLPAGNPIRALLLRASIRLACHRQHKRSRVYSDGSRKGEATKHARRVAAFRGEGSNA